MTFRHWLYLFVNLEQTAFTITAIVMYATENPVAGTVALVIAILAQVFVSAVRPRDVQELFDNAHADDDPYANFDTRNLND